MTPLVIVMTCCPLTTTCLGFASLSARGQLIVAVPLGCVPFGYVMVSETVTSGLCANALATDKTATTNTRMRVVMGATILVFGVNYCGTRASPEALFRWNLYGWRSRTIHQFEALLYLASGTVMGF